MSLKHFIIFAILIFFLERFFSFLVLLPLFLFPIFAAIYLLNSGDVARDLTRLLIAGLFFELFSGLPFGFLSAAVLAMALTVHFFRKALNIRFESFIILAFFSLLLIVEYLLLLSFEMPIKNEIYQLPAASGQIIAVLFTFYLLDKSGKRKFSGKILL